MPSAEKGAAPALSTPKAAESSTVERGDAQIVPLALALGEAAALAGLTLGTFRRRSLSAQTPAPIRCGRCVRWRRSDIERWVELGFCNRDEFEARGGSR